MKSQTLTENTSGSFRTRRVRYEEYYTWRGGILIHETLYTHLDRNLNTWKRVTESAPRKHIRKDEQYYRVFHIIWCQHLRGLPTSYYSLQY